MRTVFVLGSIIAVSEAGLNLPPVSLLCHCVRLCEHRLMLDLADASLALRFPSLIFGFAVTDILEKR